MNKTHRRSPLKIRSNNRRTHNIKTILIAFRKKQFVVELNALQCLDTFATSSPGQYEITPTANDFAGNVYLI